MKFSKLCSVILGVALLSATLGVRPAMAGDCFSDPVLDHTWTGVVISGAFVRDVACMEGSLVMTTLSAGTKLAVTGETDGWWRVRLSNGTEGWVGAQLLAVTEALYTESASQTPLSSSAAAGIRARTRGYILLQTEAHGEAWYVDPLTGQRFYMKDGPTAYEMMRTFGLGMTEADYAILAASDGELRRRLRGRIVLRVEEYGEAYYIHPNGTVYYLADGPAAYAVMRLHSLGITDLDLTAITEAELTLRPYGDDGIGEVLGETDEVRVIELSEYQAGALPGGFDIVELNSLWLDMLNTERTGRGLAPLDTVQGLVDTSANWSAYLGTRQTLTHTRPYGENLLAWAKGSYDTYDFGENLSMVYADTEASEMQRMLAESFAMFMSEESYNGMHFQNVVDARWDVTAVGVYFNPVANGTRKAYLTFHFASAAN
ncbi:MAG: SH3 domain-containing protein [Patescibacteria group bacterium]